MEDFDLGLKAFCFCWVSHIMCYLHAKEPQRSVSWVATQQPYTFLGDLETHALSF